MEQASLPWWTCVAQLSIQTLPSLGLDLVWEARAGRVSPGWGDSGMKKMGMWGLPSGERSRVSLDESHDEPCALEGRGVDPRLPVCTWGCCGGWMKFTSSCPSPLGYQYPLLWAVAKLSSGAGDVTLPGTTVLRAVCCHIFYMLLVWKPEL